MRIIEKGKNPTNEGYYAFLECNDEVYYIDSVDTFDCSFETMIFKCDSKIASEQNINFNDLYCEHYSNEDSMIDRHDEILNMTDEEFLKLLKDYKKCKENDDFISKEKLVRADEREKIIELIKNDRVGFDFEDNYFNSECYKVYNSLKERLINKIKEE